MTKRFCSITAKVTEGKPGDKTVTVHINKKDRQQAIKLASGIFQALAHNKGVDITISKYKSLKKRLARVTVTAPK